MARIDSAATERRSKFASDSEQKFVLYKAASPSSTARVYRRTDSINSPEESVRNTQNREKSVTSNKTSPKSQLLKSNTMEMLNHIEMRLGELKITIKKSNTEQSEQSEQMRESVKERWNKHKPDNRKYSGEVSYFSPIAKKLPVVESPKSVRNPHKRSFKVGLENIVEASEEENNRKESTDTTKMQLQKQQQLLTQQKVVAVSGVTTTIETNIDGNSSTMVKKSAVVNSIAINSGPPLISKNSDTMSRSSKMKEPKNKIDFEELKKSEFESFFNSSEGYVHEFLGVLDDGAGARPSNTKPSVVSQVQQPTDVDRHRHREDDFRSRSRNNVVSPRGSNDQSPSKPFQEDKRSNDAELRNRISQAISQSNRALERYRKLSIHSISTEFGKSKRANGDVRAT
ncbi:MAG: hypothetical protein JST59_01605 [Actinobacteria bacterium]|nr:hypothetical protein [Actinomycetota bacterium]